MTNVPHTEGPEIAARARRALAAVECGSEWLLWVSQEGKAVDGSAELCCDLGYELDQLISLKFAPVAELSADAWWLQKWAEIAHAGNSSFAAHIQTHTGTAIPVHVSAVHFPPSPSSDECILLRLSRFVPSAEPSRPGVADDVDSWLTRSFFEAMEDSVAIYKIVTHNQGQPVDYHLQDVNTSRLDVTGQRREDLIGKSAKLVYPAHASSFVDSLGRVARTGNNDAFELFYLPLAKWLYVTVTQVKPGYLAVICADHTSVRKHSEAQEAQVDSARSQASELDAAINSIATGVIVCDPDHRIIRINSEATSILGYTIDDAPKTSMELMAALDPIDEAGVRISSETPFVQSAMAGHRIAKIVNTVLRKDGRRIWITTSASPVISNTGKHIGVIISFSDVTDRVELQRALLRKDEILTANLSEIDFLLEHTPIGLFTLDAEFRVRRHNKIFAAIAASANGVPVQNGTRLGDILFPVAYQLELLRSHLFDDGDILTNIEIVGGQNRNHPTDQYWLASFYPRRDETGVVSSLLCSIADVTESKSNEARWRRNSSLLDRVEEIVRLGYWELDLGARTFWASKVVRDIYDLRNEICPVEEVRSRALPEYHDLLTNALSNLVENGVTYDIEFQVKRPVDGSIVDVRSRALYHKEEHKVIGVLQDITLQNEAAGNLKKLSQAVEQNPSSIVITDPGGTIQYVNPAFTDVTGYSLDEAIGQNPRILKSELTSPTTYSELWQTLKSGEVWRGTLCNKNKAGELYWESVSISPIKDAKGKLTNYVAVKENITQRVSADMELAALSSSARKRFEYLKATHDVELSLRGATETTELIGQIVSQFASALQKDCVTLWMQDPDLRDYSPVADHTATGAAMDNETLYIRGRLVSDAARNAQPTTMSRADCAAIDLPDSIGGYGVFPLVLHNQVLAVIEFYTRTPAVHDDEWWDFLEMIGAVCALALHNTSLFEEIRDAHIEVTDAYDATLAGWSQALDLRDRETEGHSQRVTDAAVKMARRLGFNDNEIVQVRRGALLHDIGKLGVPDRILGKPGKLDEEEWQIMRMHPVYAFEWLSRIPFLHPALNIPHFHHEHFDGHGYPLGMAANSIPREARLFTVIDVWDALTHDRPYRSAWPPEKARQYMMDERGKLFDPQMVDVFLNLVDDGEIG
ncbi:MAG TPA: PAS domain S-box protein [Capsulimonadaceae bacterium]|jgi:PAS domain S-box-containing protein